MIETAQECALAAAAGTDDDHDLALAHIEVYAAQHMVMAKILVDTAGFHHPTVYVRWHHATAPPHSGLAWPLVTRVPASGPMRSPRARNAPPFAAAQSPRAWSAPGSTAPRR